ncbi:hypothetical protein [Paenibacillus sp. MER 99-2]|uniref:hypothetical protein n=1 Tax=Paenibacillus sp. MER 99-2 TaxID=2939572 RepID=UPI00203E8F72|nr:hypothetical protein [Paenibacillus sp. MER 99-2]MCM3173244.1 hypothetical protein [Paenibacillus sp. MER 99-2]
MDIVKVDNPTWSGDIKSILEDVEDGIFNKIDAIENDRLGLDWWQLKSNDEVIDVLWIDCGVDEILYDDQGEVAEISFCFRKEYRKEEC